MQVHNDLFINGCWTQTYSNLSIDVINPATEEVWARVPDGNRYDIDYAVEAATTALSQWSSLAPHGRAEYLHQLADEIEARTEEFIQTITAENGTPITESSAA